MDKMIYVAMTGARESMRAQSVVSHNLANVGTHGFRALQHSLQSAPIPGQGFESRINALGSPGAWDASQGPLIDTGRDLDIAIRGDGWLAVQGQDGEEAYTRAGNLRVNAQGMLETAQGQLVLGNGGPISLPPYQSLTIGEDGLISIVPQGQKPDTIAEVDRLKLVNPPADELVQTDSGLYRTISGDPPAADAAVRISSGQLEGSNVNSAEALVQMIEISRNYEMQVRAMHVAEENDQNAARLMRLGG
jgi:flagellar basal-body rod protein FlgF